jgi:hypothetical protein
MEKVYSFVQSLNKFGSKFEKLYDYMDVQNFSWSLVLYKKLYEHVKWVAISFVNMLLNSFYKSMKV